MLFRHLLTNHYVTGKRGKYISRRTRLGETDKPSILIVDCSYLCMILDSKHKSKSSKLYNKLTDSLLQVSPKSCLDEKKALYDARELILTLLSRTIDITTPDNIILVYGSGECYYRDVSEGILQEILDPLGFRSVKLVGATFANYLFTVCQNSSNDVQDYRLQVVTNNITAWACSSHTLAMSFIAYSKNNRPIYYNGKTGLDLLCKFINTSRIINKLGLDDLKYVNLQYLYLLLLYVQFLHHKGTKPFYFDAKYFKENKNIPYEEFLNSSGEGLNMIAQAHKSLSYIFLTKPDLMDQFLFYGVDNFVLNLKRLLKITEFDVALMTQFASYYIDREKLRTCGGYRLPIGSAYSIPSQVDVVLYPAQYAAILKSLSHKKNALKIPKKSLREEPETTDMVSGDDEAIAKILRNLLW